MAEGRSNQGIADVMVVTPHAVEKHVTSIFMKLGIAAAPGITGAYGPCWPSSALECFYAAAAAAVVSEGSSSSVACSRPGRRMRISRKRRVRRPRVRMSPCRASGGARARR